MTVPVSNPINVLISDRVQIGLGGYASHLLAASVIAIAGNVALFLLMFRREVGRRFQADWRVALADAISDRRLFRLTWVGLVVLAAGYLAASAVRLPLGAVAAGGSAMLTVLALAARNLRIERIRAHVSLSLLLYVAGLLVLVRGVEAVGLTTAAVGLLTGLPNGPLGQVAAGLTGGAVAANLMSMLSAAFGLPPTWWLVDGTPPWVGGLPLVFVPIFQVAGIPPDETNSGLTWRGGRGPDRGGGSALRFGARGSEAMDDVDTGGQLLSFDEGFLHPMPRAAGIWSIEAAANTEHSITRLHQSHGPTRRAGWPGAGPAASRTRPCAGQGKASCSRKWIGAPGGAGGAHSRKPPRESTSENGASRKSPHPVRSTILSRAARVRKRGGSQLSGTL